MIEVKTYKIRKEDLGKLFDFMDKPPEYEAAEVCRLGATAGVYYFSSTAIEIHVNGGEGFISITGEQAIQDAKLGLEGKLKIKLNEEKNGRES